MLSNDNLELMHKAAEGGDIEACAALAGRYEYGLDVHVDKVKAFYWLEVGAKHGDPWAIFNIGDCYESGRLVGIKDLQKAFTYYQLALKHEYKNAFSKIAYFYEYGLAVDQNRELAFVYTEMDADINNSPWAQIHIARMYELGIGCVASYQSMDFYLEKAISNFLEWGITIENIICNAKEYTVIEAYETMGYIYRFGFFAINVDLEVANYWFSEAEAIKSEILRNN